MQTLLARGAHHDLLQKMFLLPSGRPASAIEASTTSQQQIPAPVDLQADITATVRGIVAESIAELSEELRAAINKTDTSTNVEQISLLVTASNIESLGSTLPFTANGRQEHESP